MGNSTHAMDEYAAAAHGLAIAAGGSALNRVLDQSSYADPLSAMRNVARLLEKAEKATTCMVIAQKAEADGDKDLAARGWAHALTTMNILAVEASRPTMQTIGDLQAMTKSASITPLAS